MTLRPLVIGAEQKLVIQQLVKHAEEHPVSIHEVVRAMGNPDRAVGNDPSFQCVIPLGYLCVYSHEQQTPGMCKHLSVSVDGDGKAPSPAALLMLMQEFGFRGGFESLDSVWEEQISDSKSAINVLQLIK
jgi:hypothetical protein